MKLITLFSLFATFLFLSSSCRKEHTVIEYVPEEHNWKPDRLVRGTNKIMLNGHAAPGHLYLLTPYSFWDIPRDLDFDEYQSQNSVSFNFMATNLSIDYKPRMTDYFYVCHTGDFLYIPTMNLYTINDVWRMNFALLDTAFFKFAYTPRWAGYNVGVLNNYVLVPYLNKYDPKIMSFQLIKLRYKYVLGEPLPDHVETVWTKKIEVPNPGTARFVFDIYSVNGRFLVPLGDRTLAIDTSGQVINEFEFPLARIFHDKADNAYYSFDQYDHCHRSVDQGEYWEDWGFLPAENWDRLTFTDIYGVPVAFTDSRIFRIAKIQSVPNELAYELKELDNDGLQWDYITSIIPYNDTIVYAATLSGAYYCTKEKFFKEK